MDLNRVSLCHVAYERCCLLSSKYIIFFEGIVDKTITTMIFVAGHSRPNGF